MRNSGTLLTLELRLPRALRYMAYRMRGRLPSGNRVTLNLSSHHMVSHCNKVNCRSYRNPDSVTCLVWEPGHTEWYK